MCCRVETDRQREGQRHSFQCESRPIDRTVIGFRVVVEREREGVGGAETHLTFQCESTDRTGIGFCVVVERERGGGGTAYLSA